jgi:hypothetical protein
MCPVFDQTQITTNRIFVSMSGNSNRGVLANNNEFIHASNMKRKQPKQKVYIFYFRHINVKTKTKMKKKTSPDDKLL